MKSFFYKSHLILGLCSGLILVVIGITGSLLSFEQDVLAYLNNDTYTVPISKKEKIPLTKLLESFQEKQNNLKIDKIKFSNIENRSIVLYCLDIKSNQKLTYYIDPYTSIVLKKEKGISFFRTIESIHRTLLLKNVGKNIIGICVVIFLILILSGIYILVIKFKKNIVQLFILDTKSKGKSLLSNIHSILGVWLFPFYLLSIFSGLNWSYPLYNNTIYQLLKIEKTKKNITQKDKIKIDSSIEDIAKAIRLFNQAVPRKYLYSLLKITPSGSSYSFLYMDKTSNHRRERNKLLLDIRSEKIIRHERFEDKPFKEQIMISMLTIHTGEYFGLTGKITMFFISLLLPILCISGILLYGKKRKKRL